MPCTNRALAATCARTPLAGGASLAIHEIAVAHVGKPGRPLAALLEVLLPTPAAEPSRHQLGNVDLETFYKGINKVEPSLIRVEADEATYNLHIMLRLELEIALMEGSWLSKTCPKPGTPACRTTWASSPPNDAQGVLQDVHWSGGMIGYFPTYALGNLISPSCGKRSMQDIPDLDDQIEHGKFERTAGLAAHRTSTATAPSSNRRNWSSASPAPRSTPHPTCATCNNKYSDIYGL